MKITPFFRWYDLRVGPYYDQDAPAFYIGLLPMIGLKITWARYYAILSEYDDTIIGYTHTSDKQDVLEEEPNATLRRISKEEYEMAVYGPGMDT